MDSRKLTQRERDILNEFERGRRLRDTRSTEGWRDVKELMDAMVSATQEHLIKAEYADATITQAYQRRARAFREFRDTFLGEVDKAIEQANQVPRLLTIEPAELDQTIEQEQELI